LELDVTFWVSTGMRTKIREAAEKFGNKIFRALHENTRTRLIFNLINVYADQEILLEDLEYKNCPLDLTLTDT
jgi:hypothetical protein